MKTGTAAKDSNRGRVTIMELKLFTNLIDAIGKVAGGLKSIVSLPKAEREAMRRALDETYLVIGTTSNTDIMRLRSRLL
jgi:hypothetical protein